MLSHPWTAKWIAWVGSLNYGSIISGTQQDATHSKCSARSPELPTERSLLRCNLVWPGNHLLSGRGTLCILSQDPSESPTPLVPPVRLHKEDLLLLRSPGSLVVAGMEGRQGKPELHLSGRSPAICLQEPWALPPRLGFTNLLSLPCCLELGKVTF